MIILASCEVETRNNIRSTDRQTTYKPHYQNVRRVDGGRGGAEKITLCFKVLSVGARASESYLLACLVNYFTESPEYSTHAYVTSCIFSVLHMLIDFLFIFSFFITFSYGRRSSLPANFLSAR